MSGRYGDDPTPDEPAPWRSPKLVPKPDWYDELAADSRLAARERWFTPDGRHRAYLGAEQPPQPDRSKREDAA